MSATYSIPYNLEHELLVRNAIRLLRLFTENINDIQQRVEQAKQLLLQGKMSLAEIAIACGFSHQSHLNRHFKRLTGVTPKTLLKS